MKYKLYYAGNVGPEFDCIYNCIRYGIKLISEEYPIFGVHSVERENGSLEVNTKFVLRPPFLEIYGKGIK